MLSEQGGKCVICEKRLTRSRKPVVDHNHTTGEEGTAMLEEFRRVYLAGPMRGHFMYNFPMFDAAASWLERRYSGLSVVSPAAMDRERGCNPCDPTCTTTFEEIGGFHEAMRADIAAILTVDAIILLPGWVASAGTTAEVFVARQIGIPVFELKWHNNNVVIEEVDTEQRCQ